MTDICLHIPKDIYIETQNHLHTENHYRFVSKFNRYDWTVTIEDRDWRSIIDLPWIPISPFQNSDWFCYLWIPVSPLLKFRPIQRPVDSCMEIGPIWRFSDPCTPLLKFWRVRRFVGSLHLLWKNSDPFSGTGNPASHFWNLYRFGGSWFPASLFKNMDRFDGSWMPFSSINRTSFRTIQLWTIHGFLI